MPFTYNARPELLDQDSPPFTCTLFPLQVFLSNSKFCHLHTLLNLPSSAHFTSSWVTYWTDAISLFIVTVTFCPDSLFLAYYP